MFKYLDTEEKGYLEEKDFVPIFPGKTQRAFLVFDVGLNGKIDAIQFTRAIDEIYFARKQIWDSYVDRKR